MKSREVLLEVATDSAEGRRLGLRSIPFLFVNGKQVSRWRNGDDYLLEPIVAEAARQGDQ